MTTTQQIAIPDCGLGANNFDGVTLSLFDLFRERLRAGAPALEGVIFNNCRIEGPSVMLVVGGVTFDRVNFGYAGDNSRSLVLLPASRERVVGAIPVKDCKFTHCQFVAVGFTGGDEFLKQLLAVKAAS